MGNEITRRDVMKGLVLQAYWSAWKDSFVRVCFRAQSAPGAAPPARSGSASCPPSPMPSDALEPHIDKETLLLHHDKHHAAM